jgi:hypothetical protein
LTLLVLWLVARPAVWAGSAPPPPRNKTDEEGIAHEGRVRRACAEIIREVDRRSQPVNPAAVGKALNQDAMWVQRCMENYGRRIAKPALGHVEAKEEEQEAWESAEEQEVGDEETGDARTAGHGRPEGEARQRHPTPDPLDQLDQ